MQSPVAFLHVTSHENLERIREIGFLITSYNMFFLGMPKPAGLTEKEDIVDPNYGQFPGVYMTLMFVGEAVDIENGIGLIFPTCIAKYENNWHYNPQDNMGFVYRGTSTNYADITMENRNLPEIVFHDPVSMDLVHLTVEGRICLYSEITHSRYTPHQQPPRLLSYVDFYNNLGTESHGQLTEREYVTYLINGLRSLNESTKYLERIVAGIEP